MAPDEGVFVVPTFADRAVTIAGRDVPGYLAQPDDAQAHPAIIVVHEWWGLTDYTRGIAQQLAQEGFTALAPDLYRGHLALTVERAMVLSRGLDPAAGAADLLAAIAYLRLLPSVGDRPIGMIGFCMGGSFTLEVAMRSNDLTAIAPFYPGRVGQAIEHLQAISPPLFVAFGAEDPSIPPDVVQRFGAAVRRHGKTAEIRVYQGAKHAFHNHGGANYHPEAAADAWAGALAFFRERLGTV